MKKLLLIAFLMTGISASYAQLYVRASVGYNLPMGAQQLDTEEIYTSDGEGQYSTTFKGVYGSYGSGVSGRVGFGGELSGILGFDIELGYLSGKQYTSEDKSIYSGYESLTKNEYKSSAIQFTPALTFTGGGTGKIVPIARVGPMVSITTLKGEESSSNTYNNYTQKIEYKYSGNISFGFKGAVGIQYALSEKMQFCAEVDFITMSYGPKKREITAYEVNGQDVMDQIDPDTKEIDYEKEQTLVNEEGDPVIRPTFPMGSIGIQLGVKFNL